MWVDSKVWERVEREREVIDGVEGDRRGVREAERVWICGGG